MINKGNNDILRLLYYNNKTGFPNLRNLIRSAKKHGIDRDYVKDWYNRQTVNQIIVR